MIRRLFVPGWGASTMFYEPALAPAWEVAAPPSFRRGGGRLERYVRWLVRELDAGEGAVVLGGHSMGGALAVLAALERPARISELVLVQPAGLPLTKPVRRSLAAFAGQVARGEVPRSEARRGAAAVLAAPRAALRLARDVRALDLARQLQQLQQLGIPCRVVGCVTDTLTPVAHCRRIADLAGAAYRELDVSGGHMWMLRSPGVLAEVVA
jgi:pimeloyl-ACP methyl ester carboxylesterase